MLPIQDPKINLASLEVETRRTGVVDLGLDTPWNSQAHDEDHALATFEVQLGERRSFKIELDVVLEEGTTADQQVRERLQTFTQALHDEARRETRARSH